MKEINKKDLKELSKRKNSETFITNDNKWIIKFDHTFSESRNNNYEKEIFSTNFLRSLNVPTPEVGEIVKDKEGDLGLEYEYIEDKVSFSRAVSKNPEKIEEYMIRFSELAKKIHSTNINKNNIKTDIKGCKYILSIEELINQTLEKRKNIYTEDRVNKIKNIMSNIEKTNNLLHLDFQPGNYIMSKKGDFMIDLQTISYGNPLYDIGLFYYLYHYISEEGLKAVSRCEKDLAIKMWRTFIKYYYNFINEKEIDDFEEKIRPISILSAIAVDNYIHHDSIQEYIDKNFENLIK